jgi:hypothetical protein
VADNGRHALTVGRLGRVPLEAVLAYGGMPSVNQGFYLKGLLGVLSSAGLEYASALRLGMLSGAALACAALYRLRRSSLWLQAGVVAPIALSYTYSRRYDYVLAVLMLPALVRVGKATSARHQWPIVTVSGLLCLPITEAAWTSWIPILLQGALLAAALWVVLQADRVTNSAADS